MTSSRIVAGAVAAVSVIGVVGCSSKASGGPEVTATDTACSLSAPSLAAGTHTFVVKNDGGKVTEVYVYKGDTALGEVENVGPGLSRKLTVQLSPGTYAVTCKPGMTGKGISTPLRITGDSDVAATDPVVTRGVADYTSWVRAQVALLVTRADAFTAAVLAGDIAKAKRLYGPSREPWERIEPVAESFGDLDPRLDARQNDVNAGESWTGWHRLEKALWVDRSLDGMAPIARQMRADVRELRDRTRTTQLNAAQLGNGAKELLDEVATGKVTGEEERYSHLDLLDFEANVEGARRAYLALRPALTADRHVLVNTLDTRFASLRRLLSGYRTAAGWTPYDELSQQQVRELAAAVDALGEPLSQLTAAVVRA